MKTKKLERATKILLANLVDGLVAPPGVHPPQLGGQPVVLSHEEGVQHDQVQLLVHAEVASKETIL